jgi:hypothetical protein
MPFVVEVDDLLVQLGERPVHGIGRGGDIALSEEGDRCRMAGQIEFGSVEWATVKTYVDGHVSSWSKDKADAHRL